MIADLRKYTTVTIATTSIIVVSLLLSIEDFKFKKYAVTACLLLLSLAFLRLVFTLLKNTARANVRLARIESTIRQSNGLHAETLEHLQLRASDTRSIQKELDRGTTDFREKFELLSRDGKDQYLTLRRILESNRTSFYSLKQLLEKSEQIRMQDDARSQAFRQEISARALDVAHATKKTAEMLPDVSTQRKDIDTLLENMKSDEKISQVFSSAAMNLNHKLGEGFTNLTGSMDSFEARIQHLERMHHLFTASSWQSSHRVLLSALEILHSLVGTGQYLSTEYELVQARTKILGCSEKVILDTFSEAVIYALSTTTVNDVLLISKSVEEQELAVGICELLGLNNRVRTVLLEDEPNYSAHPNFVDLRVQSKW